MVVGIVFWTPGIWGPRPGGQLATSPLKLKLWEFSKGSLIIYQFGGGTGNNLEDERNRTTQKGRATNFGQLPKGGGGKFWTTPKGGQ